MLSPSVFSRSLMGSKPASAQRSPEPKPENPRIPPVQQKEVLLFEWWLMKAEKSYNGRRLTVEGFTRRGEAVGIFRSAPIIKRHDHCTLETVDVITVKIQGPINETRTIDNGFSLEVSNAFLLGFPTTWDNFIEESSGNNPSDCRMLEHRPENTFDPSFQKKTVLLRNWWLRKAEKGSGGNRLAVGGFTECGKAMRLFDSSPIIKRHDAYTLDTADGITIRIEGFINKMRTLDNGFPLEACRTFLIGFPTTWTDFAHGSSWAKSSQADILVSASRDAEWSKDSLENDPFGFPVKSENTIPDNAPSTSNTSVCDSYTRLQETIRRFTALVSMPNPTHLPLVDRGYLHLPEKSCGANLRDARTGNNDHEAAHTPADIDSVNHGASYTDGVHTEGAGCLAGDLHVDGLHNHEKLEFVQDEVTKAHHDEGLWGSVVGKDHQKEEIAQQDYEKFDECSTRRPVKVRSGLSKVEHLVVEDQKYAKFGDKPVRRSLRLKSLNPENSHGEFQGNSQLLDETDDVNCASLVPGGSKTCMISQPTDTLAEGCSSYPNLYVEPLKISKSIAKPVGKIKRSVLQKHENIGEFQRCSQLLNGTNHMNHSILKGSPLSPTSSLLLPSDRVISVENQDVHQRSINTCLGVTPNSNPASQYGCCDLGQSLNDKKTFSSDSKAGPAEVTPANSKAVTSQTTEKRMPRHNRKTKDNHTVHTTKSRIELASYSSKEVKNVEVSTKTQQAEDKASHKMGYTTVWVSSYKDVHCTPLTRYKKNNQTSLTPESLNLKRSRSGRLLIPRLDCSMRVMYEPDGSFVGAVTVDGSCAEAAGVVMSTSPPKGRLKTPDRKKLKKRR